MRLDLYEDPAVTYMAERIGQREEVVVGYLHRIWAWASRQSQDGCVKHVTLTSLGRVTSLPDFPQLMADAGWLEHGVDTDGKPYISFPNWDRWLGESAKKRISASRRKQKERVTKMSQNSVTQKKKKDHIAAAVRQQVYQRDGFTCVYCGWNPKQKAPIGPYIGAALSVHHVVPESRGGETNADNLATCCTVCNRRLSNKTPDELRHENVTKVCDKSVTTVEKRREEKDNTEVLSKRESGKPDSPAVEQNDGEHVLAEWNRLMGQACKWTAKREVAFKQRWRNAYWRENWQAAALRAARSSFCRGENDRSWVADVEWFLKPDTVTKLMEGKYDDREVKQKPKPVTFGQQRQQNTLDLLERLKAQDEAAAAGVAGFIGEASK